MKKYICPHCGGDGKETCTNPDHGFIAAIGTVRLNGHANGCPCCGNDPDHKVPNGGSCETCLGTGCLTQIEFDGFCDDYGYDEEPIELKTK